MFNEKLIVDNLIEKISHQVSGIIKESISQTIENEIARALTKSLIESEFYRHLNTEIRDGLGSIYKEISNARKSDTEQASLSKTETKELFNEASDQLANILETTEKATVQIMDIVEKQMVMHNKTKILLDVIHNDSNTNYIGELIEMNNILNDDLMEVMTTLSFQDLTGQRIKRIITTLRKVEEIVFDLFISTGLIIKAKEEHPDQDYEEIKQQSKKRVDELKGPQSGVSQNDVDDLLSQLGF